MKLEERLLISFLDYNKKMYSLATIDSREMKIAKSINKNVVETIRHIENKHKRSFNSIPRRFLFITSEYIIY